jgi:hypothetical protein
MTALGWALIGAGLCLITLAFAMRRKRNDLD